MKITISILLATLVITFTAFAAPVLLVKTTITENHANGDKDVLEAPWLTVESGKKATIPVGKFEYTVTPTLLKDGYVDLFVILNGDNGNEAVHLNTHITAKLGQVAVMGTGKLVLTIEISLAK